MDVLPMKYLFLTAYLWMRCRWPMGHETTEEHPVRLGRSFVGVVPVIFQKMELVVRI